MSAVAGKPGGGMAVWIEKIHALLLAKGNKNVLISVFVIVAALAIGNKGQNAKLAARLTGFKIDIKPENPVG